MVSRTNDPLEQEAEAIAEWVVSLGTQPSVTGPVVQRQAVDRGATARGDAPTGPVTPLGAGRLLDAENRSYFERRFAFDFSRTRIHDDDAAHRAASALGAKAFTTGEHVVFGADRFHPGTTGGRRLLAHELAHVVQQHRSRTPVVMRVPNESGIKAMPPRYSYSTNCGWIDWGHTIPTYARNVIAVVREAAMRLRRKEAAVTAAAPFLHREDRTRSNYEPGEVESSAHDPPAVKLVPRGAGIREFHLAGFGVGSEDATKFREVVKALAASHLRKDDVVEVSGFTDRTGSRRENTSLRVGRAAAVLLLLTESGVGSVQVVSHSVDEYLASNETREGRRENRGTLIRFIPKVQPERLVTPEPGMRSGALGITVNRAQVVFEIGRGLNEDQVLSVALSVFARQSIAFEALQTTTDKIARSSFSEEDLPSNLISFYRAARGFSREEVERIADVWDAERSLAKFKGYTFKENRTFRPPQLPPGGSWPAEFASIPFVKEGSDTYQIVEFILEGPINTVRGK
jgi:outer membrane protein OmpA-like peptidoglycan-associated protein